MQLQPSVTRRFFQTDPVHLIRFDSKLALLAEEVADIVGIQNIEDDLRQSRILEKGVDWNTVPENLLAAECQELTAYLEQRFKSSSQIAILFLSGFFLHVPLSGKPISISLTRWMLSDVVPIAFSPPAMQSP